MPQPEFDLYLIHAEGDTLWVEDHIAKRLTVQGLKPWLYKWQAIPGNSWQDIVTTGIKSARSCAVCLGVSDLEGRFKQVYEVAQSQKHTNSSFTVLPVLLPTAIDDHIPLFLKDVEKIDLRDTKKFDEMFYRLICGIRGEPPGPWPPPSTHTDQPDHDTWNIVDSNFELILKRIKAAETKMVDKERTGKWRDDAFEYYIKKLVQSSVDTKREFDLVIGMIEKVLTDGLIDKETAGRWQDKIFDKFMLTIMGSDNLAQVTVSDVSR